LAIGFWLYPTESFKLGLADGFWLG
jgi:hypothetical protein